MLISKKWQRIDFLGNDELSIEIKPLNALDYQKIFTLLPQGLMTNTGELNFETEGLKLMKSPELFETIEEVFKKYTRSLKGFQIELEDGEIKDGSIIDFLNTGGTLPHCISLLMRIFSISNLTPKEEDTLKKPLANT